MRAGAIPLLAWSGLIGALFVIHLLMTGAAVGDPIDTAVFGFAVGIILGCAIAGVAEDRDAVRSGPPEPDTGVEALPAASLGALVVAVAVVACGFGLVFGSFLVFISAGLFVAGVFVLARELAGERRARRGRERGGGA